MSIWSRFKRAMRSIFGGAVSSMEDPRLILEQNIRELNDQVPKMNDNISTVKANVIMLEKEVKQLEKRVEALTSTVKAAIEQGRDDIAEEKAMRLEKEKESLQKTKEQLKYASSAYDKAIQVKKNFMRDKEKKIEEARSALREHERAKWQGRVADAMEQFEVSGLDQTHDEMMRRINEETAKNEARMEMALDSVDSESLQIEEDAERLRAAEVVKQFKLEMGVEDEEEPAKLDAPKQKEKEKESSDSQPSKTIGKQRERE